MLSYYKRFVSRLLYPGFTRGCVNYVQGQEPEPRVREYFYYIDHQGMLYLDDTKMKNFTSCLKDKKFLQFFFKRIQINDTSRYRYEFPYTSLCGREKNYIRCDDVPIVFTHIYSKNNQVYLSYAHAEDLLSTEFMPEKVFMLPKTGRVYHPAKESCGSIGLIRSKLAIELSKYFEFGNGDDSSPTHLLWDGKKYTLDQEWFYDAVKKHNIKIRNFN